MLKKIYNSSILNSWFSNVVIIFNMLIALPFVITKLSVEAVNVWFLFATIVSLTQGIVLGFSSTFSRFISYVYAGIALNEVKHLAEKKKISHGDTNLAELEKILNVIIPLYFLLSTIFLIILSIIGYIFLKNPILSMEDPSEGWLAWSIVLISSTFILSLNFYQVFLDGINQVALVQRIIGLVNLIGLSFIIIVLVYIPSLISITIIYQFVSLSTMLVISFFSYKKMKSMGLKTNFHSFDIATFFLIWDTAKKSLFTTIIANIVRHISSLIVAQLLPPAQSASFQFVKRVFDVIERFTTATFQSKLPLLSRLRGRGDINGFTMILKKIQYISYAVFLLGYVIFLFLGEHIVNLLNSEIFIDKKLIVAFAFSILATRWTGIGLAISNQSNKVIEHWAIAISSALYFILIFLFIDKLGFYAFPLAQLTSMLLISPLIIYQVYNTFNTKFILYEKRMLFPIILTTFLISLLGL